jgi:hypothetical protein
MKNLKRVLLGLVCTSLLAGCSKSDWPGDDPVNDDLKAATADVIIIPVGQPSGGDDTEAFKAAFAAAQLAGPGAVVLMEAGEYHLGFLEVYDFVGSFMGAGMDETIITVMNHMDGQSVLDRNLLVDLIKFVGGDVLMSNFTLQTPEGKLTDTGLPAGNIKSLVALTTGNPGYEFNNEERSIRAVIDQVRFVGHELEGGPGYTKGHNCNMGVRAGYDCLSGSDVSRAKIDVKITNSEFYTFTYALALAGTRNGRLIIGEKNNGNIFNDNDLSVAVWETRHTEVRIEGNTVNVPAFAYGMDLDDQAWYGILKKEPESEPTVFNVQNNEFNLAHSEYALYLQNMRHRQYPDEVPVTFQVKNNLFNMTDGYEWALLSYYTTGVVIRNNQFRGYGDLGLYLVNYSENGLVLGNNFSTATWGTGVAYLTASTRNWTFVGGDLGESIINAGTKNLITGFNVNQSEVPFGETIVDNMQDIKDVLKSLKGK